VDLNRAGTPLLEIVTQPDLHSADDAVAFCQQLRDLCRHMGVTAGILQRGHMRFEPNINVEITTPGNEVFKTPIVEVKNLNSFKAVHGSIVYEHHRQVEAWLADRKVMSPGSKQTRGWDDNAGVTTLQREKEDAHDYRYFPDPDLIEVAIDDAWLDRLKSTQPESPHTKRDRWANTLKLKPADADQLLTEPANTAFFEQCLQTCDDATVAPRLAALLLNTGMKRANESHGILSKLGITPTQVAELLSLLNANKISSTAADKLFNLLCDHADAPADQTPGSVEQLAQQHGLLQVNDTAALDAWVKQALDDPRNAKAVDDLRAGTDKAIGALIGQVMKLSKGSANPKLVTETIKRLL
jgi:aspartyl-tRNA(Asn)/glutamyl-tRNA(Gln) amidotransferase subunit B